MVRVRALQVRSCEFESHCLHQKIFNMTITSLIFYFLSFTTILSGVLVITSKNPITSVVYLVATFVSCAAIFLLFGVNLLGFIYIIVYVGAIAILFIFVIMMMDLRNISDESYNSKNNNYISEKFHYPLAFIILIAFIALNISIFNNEKIDNSLINNIIHQDYFSTWEIAQKNIWDSLLISMDLIHSIGYILYTDFLSLLLLASLILLMIMVGVIVLIVNPKD